MFCSSLDSLLVLRLTYACVVMQSWMKTDALPIDDNSGIASLLLGPSKEHPLGTLKMTDKPTSVHSAAKVDLATHPAPQYSILAAISPHRYDVGTWDPSIEVHDYALAKDKDTGKPHLTPFTGYLPSTQFSQGAGCHVDSTKHNMKVSYELTGTWGVLRANNDTITLSERLVREALLLAVVTALEKTSQDSFYPIYSSCIDDHSGWATAAARDVPFRCSEDIIGCTGASGCGWSATEPCPNDSCGNGISATGPCYAKKHGRLVPSFVKVTIFHKDAPLPQSMEFRITEAKKLIKSTHCDSWMKYLYAALQLVSGLWGSVMKAEMGFACTALDDPAFKYSGGDS